MWRGVRDMSLRVMGAGDGDWATDDMRIVEVREAMREAQRANVDLEEHRLKRWAYAAAPLFAIGLAFQAAPNTKPTAEHTLDQPRKGKELESHGVVKP